MKQPSSFLLFLFLLTLISLPFRADAQDQDQDPDVDSLIRGGLQYLAQTQKKETQDYEFFKGEWGSQMEMILSFPGLGWKGKKAPDSNLFTTASVHQALAQVFLLFPDDYPQILPMLQLSMENIMLYKEDSVFSFWQKIPPRSHLANETSPPVRRSNRFFIGPRVLNYAENIPADADDTALAYTSLFYHHKVGLGAPTASDSVPSPIGPLFSAFRDQKRKIFNPFNYVYGGRKKVPTGAFLTWLKEEKRGPRYAIPRKNRLYMPFGLNDVDCVVNANVLSALTLYGELATTPGVEQSCTYLKKMIRLRNHQFCGMYYPNWYNFYFNATQAYSHGLQCLEEEIPRVVEVLQRNQNKDGSWYSFYNGKNHDTVHATAYALGSLLHIGQMDKYGTRTNIQKAVAYLKTKVKKAEDGSLSWEGGIFFSGGTVVRKVIVWKSDAYTTAIILKSLALYKKKGAW